MRWSVNHNNRLAIFQWSIRGSIGVGWSSALTQNGALGEVQGFGVSCRGGVGLAAETLYLRGRTHLLCTFRKIRYPTLLHESSFSAARDTASLVRVCKGGCILCDRTQTHY